jgi:poly-beta-1,6-N-acetyl-D-glucosamine synthase
MQVPTSLDVSGSVDDSASIPGGAAKAGSDIGSHQDLVELPNYILITPARNEGEYIERTIQSLVAQTALPMKWVIVSDGSTDSTDDIVRKYAEHFDWIELVQMPPRAERHFAGKVIAFNAGYEKVAHLKPDIIGNLDADVTFEPDHFELLLSKSCGDPKLGLWGAPFREGGMQYDYNYSSIENVWGGCQLFRRDCFEQIGGYRPMKGGGIDHVAVLTARMNGWKTRTFTDRYCIHHRTMGTAQRGLLKARFRQGVKDRSMGNHPLWEVARSCYQMTRWPILIGGAMMGAGYFWSLLRRDQSPIPREIVAFVQREQMHRLRKQIFRF